MSEDKNYRSGKQKRKSIAGPREESKITNVDLHSGHRNTSTSSNLATKSPPSWLKMQPHTPKSAELKHGYNQEIDFELEDPENLLHKMESGELTDDETEALLQRAYGINKQLREVAEQDRTSTRVVGGSAPPEAQSKGNFSSPHRPRSRGMMEGDLLPQLQSGRHQTSLSSVVYGRTDAGSPISTQGSAGHYKSYHSAQKPKRAQTCQERKAPVYT